MKLSILATAAVLAASSTLAMAQGGPPSPGDAQPPGALKQGGIPPAAAMRRGDDMSPVSQPIGLSKPKHSMMGGHHKKVAMHKGKKMKKEM